MLVFDPVRISVFRSNIHRHFASMKAVFNNSEIASRSHHATHEVTDR